LYNLKDLAFHGIIPTLLLLLISNAIVSQQELLLLLSFAQGQQQEKNNTTTNMTNMRNAIIPAANEVNEANLELIKICVSSPNPACDNTMVIIHNDCIAYPQYVATHIPSCNDSRLISYLVARGLFD
jgi:hypothetical protein